MRETLTLHLFTAPGGSTHVATPDDTLSFPNEREADAFRRGFIAGVAAVRRLIAEVVVEDDRSPRPAPAHYNPTLGELATMASGTVMIHESAPCQGHALPLDQPTSQAFAAEDVSKSAIDALAEGMRR
jgi:hypothetical protein